MGAPRDPPYNIAFRCGRPSQSQTRVPFPGQASPWRDVGIWPGCPRGASSLTPSYADRSFQGQSPLCPDFVTWPRCPSGAFPPYTFCYRSHISRPGASLARFRHLASLPQRSLFPYPFLRRSPNPGQALPCLDFVIWPGFPTGVCSLGHSVTDHSFPGQAPVWPDFGIWLAFPRGALSLAHSMTDRLFSGQAPLRPDFGIWPAFPRGAFSLTHYFADRPFPDQESL